MSKHKGREPRKDVLMRRMEEIIPKRNMGMALLNTDDPRVLAFAERCLDPRFASSTMAKIAANVGLKHHEIVDAFRKRKVDDGIIRMFTHLPDVMEDTARDAKSRYRICASCEGKGCLPDPSDTKAIAEGKPATKLCITCEGIGRVRVSGDSDARKMMLEAAGVIGKRGPLLMQQFNTIDSGGMEDTMRDARKALTTPPRIEVTEVTTDAPVEPKEDENGA